MFFGQWQTKHAAPISCLHLYIVVPIVCKEPVHHMRKKRDRNVNLAEMVAQLLFISVSDDFVR